MPFAFLSELLPSATEIVGTFTETTHKSPHSDREAIRETKIDLPWSPVCLWRPSYVPCIGAYVTREMGPIRPTPIRKNFDGEKIMEDEAQETILTAAEVAKQLRISLPTIRQYLANGQLQGRKIGKAWRIHRDALRAFLVNANAMPNKCCSLPETGSCGKEK